MLKGKLTIRLCITVLLILSCSTLFAACAGGTANNASETTAASQAAASSVSEETQTTQPQAEKPSGPITIYVDATYEKPIKQMLTDFEKADPDITPKVIAVPFDQFDSKLQTMLASNTQPDITTHYGWAGFGEYMSKGVLADLTPYIQASGFDAGAAGIPDEVMKMFQVDGKQYAIPLNIYITLMLYNKDIFDKAGLPYPTSDYEDTTWTWDKMIETAKKLTVIDDKNPANTQYGLTWNWSAGGPEQDPQYFGHDVLPPEAVTTGFATTNNFGNPEIVNDFQKLSDLVWKDKVSPTPAFVKGMGGNNPFFAGKVAMAVDGAWAMAGLNDVKFKAGVAAIPMGGNKDVRDVLWTNAFWIFKASNNPAAAFEWIKFMAQPETQQKFVAINGDPPASVNALQAYTTYLKSVDPTDMEKVWKGSIQYGAEGISHFMVSSNEIHTLLNNELSPVNDGSKKASEVLPELQTKLNDLLAKIAEKYKK